MIQPTTHVASCSFPNLGLIKGLKVTIIKNFLNFLIFLPCLPPEKYLYSKWHLLQVSIAFHGLYSRYFFTRATGKDISKENK